jgi:hypothetical protein
MLQHIVVFAKKARLPSDTTGLRGQKEIQVRTLNLIPTLLIVAYANDNDAFVPEVWAQESLMILENNMVATNLVHRDFSNQIAQFGDVVNTRKPGSFTAKRKGQDDDVVDQDASATNVAVPLDQHLHTTFVIKDGEESKSMKSLVDEYLRPAAISLAEAADQIVLGQVYKFLPNAVGKLGTAVTKDTVIAAREKMNALKVPMSGRNLLIGPNMEGQLLGIADFVNAEKVGDDGTALREGSVGRKFGFDTYMAQQVPSIIGAGGTVTGAVNNAGGYAIGATAITVDGFAAAITNGSWCSIDGQPHRISATVGGATPTQITIDSPLRAAVADNAVIVVYTPSQVNLVAGYVAKWYKGIVYDTVTPIKTGQLVSTPDGQIFSAIGGTDGTTVMLDRPTVSSLADNAVLGRGPNGEYGFAFHRNAIAFVTRPLSTPRAGTGALSSVASYNGLGLRVTITYDGKAQGHRVTLDMLAGVKELDPSLGVPVLG